MKKIVALVGVLMVFAGVSAFAAEATPVKLSLIPTIAVPENQTVHGLDVGLVSSVNEVKGVQWAFIYGDVRNEMLGIQLDLVAKGKKVTGAQLGFINIAEDMTGVQFGLVNYTQRMKGVQIGLVNVITKGVLPAMIFVNANF